MSGPQSSQTVRLISTLRAGLIPQAERDTSLAVHVGGVTATNVDFAQVLTAKLPLFITVVVMLAFLLLTVVFRSLATGSCPASSGRRTSSRSLAMSGNDNSGYQ